MLVNSKTKQVIILLLIAFFFTQCKTDRENKVNTGTAAIESSSEKKIEQDFKSFDQTKIAFTDEGQGEAVILLHGFISNGTSWNQSELKRRLIEKGYRVIVPDLRGNGRSEKSHSESFYKNEAETKDLVALIDHLKLETCKVVGYSRGSIVLAKLLTMESRIDKAVIGGMGLDFADEEWPKRKMFADAFSGRAEPNEVTSGAVEYAESIGADLKILGLLQDYQPVTSTTELNKIQTPIMIICGEDDNENGRPEDLQKEIQNSNLVFVKGNHNDTYKQDNFAEAVMGYFKGS